MSPLERVEDWLNRKGWKAFRFQREVWEKYSQGYSGLLNAPTGSGKTMALWLPVLMEAMEAGKRRKGLQLLWITPLRALAKDLHDAMLTSAQELGVPWRVELRTGDLSAARKKKQLEKLPEVLITTPESLHLLLSYGNVQNVFGSLQAVVVDEWHELFGSKRGVMMELALSRLKSIATTTPPQAPLKIWGISATIGNRRQSMDALLGINENKKAAVVTAVNNKTVNIHSVIPEEIESFSWAGHLGLKLIPQLLPIIEQSNSTLLFTNTRGQAEIWYQRLLEAVPHLAGRMAVHHGSLSKEVRGWVEKSIHAGRLKLVVCTSSLDLGVDFAPVETVIQVGSPKGVARFLQRAGRSGHRPDAVSNIHFVPTHSLELIEGAALKEAASKMLVEDRLPYIKPMDVLTQYLVTLAAGDGFSKQSLLPEVKSTFTYSTLEQDEWEWCLQFITTGGKSLEQYSEFTRVEHADGLFKVCDKRMALRHRMTIGTIVSEINMQVRYVTGGRIGTIEEYFISRLNEGDVFWFAGKSLVLVRTRGNTAYVRRAKKQRGLIPSWQGGRMPLSSQLSAMIRTKVDEAGRHEVQDAELKALDPLFGIQQSRSVIPAADEFLIEKIETSEGHHCFFFPFEGRLVHEGMAALLAHRMAMIRPITFSIAMNDYGFELMSDEPIPLETALEKNLFTTNQLIHDIYASVNATEMALKKFYEVARVAGLIFPGFPGRMQKERHLQTSTGLLFKVFSEYDPENLLLKQCYQEVLDFQLEEYRLRQAFLRIGMQRIVITHPEHPTPFSFPILVDRMREKLSSEKLEARVKKMQLHFETPSRCRQGKKDTPKLTT